MDEMTFRDLAIMARTVWGEARGETFKGQEAVAGVILNRANSPTHWPMSVTGVCKQPWQFSCWNDRDPNLPKMLEVQLSNPALRQCTRACLAAFDQPNPCNGANHYFSRTIAQPEWAENMQQVAEVGSHIFFKA